MNKVSHDSETKARGQQVITACAFIHEKFDGIEKVFLPKRALTKKFLPGVFELPGGHINFGEDLKAGLKREILEELGMNVSVGDPFYVFTYENKIKESHSVEIDFFAKFVGSLEKIKLNPEDHSEFVWVAEKDIDEVRKNIGKDDDDELKAIRRGFLLLKGISPEFS